MVVHVNYAKNILETSAILELLALGLFRPFDKIEFSVDRSFQNCFIFVKAFWDNSDNHTLGKITRFWLAKTLWIYM